jgi:uncharacterized protein (DUF433 family)
MEFGHERIAQLQNGIHRQRPCLLGTRSTLQYIIGWLHDLESVQDVMDIISSLAFQRLRKLRDRRDISHLIPYF